MKIASLHQSATVLSSYV